MSVLNLDFSLADMSNCDLRGASLTGAILAGANLTGATLIEVIWSNSTCPDGFPNVGTDPC
jgi:uncharacterized protein YjbI with pentapeptide repeats